MSLYGALSLTTGAQPFLKWPGGKWSLRESITSLMPPLAGRTYREPFLGGGSMFFYLQPAEAVLSDVLEPLVTTWTCVRDDVDNLIRTLSTLSERQNGEEAFLATRSAFNKRDRSWSPCDTAAHFIYLNKTCFNGLCRFNRKSEFNTPYGKYENPRICDADALRAASLALRGASISQCSYRSLIDDAQPGDVIYLDPPYVPLSTTSNFVGYSGSWQDEDHGHLAAVFRELDARGCLLVLSNSDTPRTRELYAGSEITSIQARRSVGAKIESRGSVGEVVVRNIKRWPR